MDKRIAKLVALQPATVTKRLTAAQEKLAEAQGRQEAAENARNYVFAAAWEQRVRGARVEIELLTAARQIQDWAR